MMRQGKPPLLSLAHVALIGDSHFKYIQDHFPSGQHAPYIRFQSGATTNDIRNLINAAPRNITHFGTNDLKHCSGGNTFEGMKALVHDVQTNRPNAKITLTTVLPRIKNKHPPLTPQTDRLIAHSERTLT